MITKEEVLRVAQLARIQLNSEEVEKFQKDFSSILDYFALIQELDLSRVKEMTHSVEVENVLRIDQARGKTDTSGLLQTKEQTNGFLKVPKVFPSA